MQALTFDPWIAAAVIVATACTDAVYVMFAIPETAPACRRTAVLRRKRLPLPIIGSMFCFAAAGSFIGAYITMSFFHPGPIYPTQPPGSTLQ